MCGGYVGPSEYVRQENIRIAKEAAHQGLNILGFADPVGVADGINALGYAAEGNWTDAGISALAIIPLIGDLGKGFKYAGKAYSSTELAAELGYKSFTHRNYREGLMRLLGQTEDEVKGLQAHHILPQTLEKQFNAAGIENIHDPRLLTWVDSNHQGWTREYERAWRLFLDTKPDPDAILQKAQELAKAYNFEVHFKTP